MSHWKQGLVGFVAIALFISAPSFAERERIAPERVKSAQQEFAQRMEEMRQKLGREYSAAEKEKMSEMSKNFEKLKNGKMSEAEFKREQETAYRNFISTIRSTNSKVLEYAKELDYKPAEIREQSASVGRVNLGLEAEIAKISDPVMQERLREGVRYAEKRFTDKNMDAATQAKMKEKLTNSIAVANILGEAILSGELIDGKPAAGNKVLAKTHEGEEKSSRGADASKNAKSSLAAMADVVMTSGTAEDAERFSALKEAGKDALKGLMKIGDMYQEVMAEVVRTKVGKKMTAAERAKYLAGLSPAEREKLHEEARKITGERMKERFKDILSEEELKSLCAGDCFTRALCKL
jgi:hypothetical protein